MEIEVSKTRADYLMDLAVGDVFTINGVKGYFMRLGAPLSDYNCVNLTNGELCAYDTSCKVTLCQSKLVVMG